MKIQAYCTCSARRAVRAATGTKPLTSPPLHIGRFDPAWLEGYDLLYFRLHGSPKGTVWFGDLKVPALNVDQVLGADLTGTTVVVANCYGDQGPITKALYTAGAVAVVAGPGKNLAARKRVVGVDLLVRWIIRLVRRGWSLNRAVQASRIRLRFTSWRASDRDAAQFHILGEV